MSKASKKSTVVEKIGGLKQFRSRFKGQSQPISPSEYQKLDEMIQKYVDGDPSTFDPETNALKPLPWANGGFVYVFRIPTPPKVTAVSKDPNNPLWSLKLLDPEGKYVGGKTSLNMDKEAYEANAGKEVAVVGNVYSSTDKSEPPKTYLNTDIRGFRLFSDVVDDDEELN